MACRWANKAEDYHAVVTPCTTEEGEVPHASPDGMGVFASNYSYPKGLGYLACVNGTQTWPQYAYPGALATGCLLEHPCAGGSCATAYGW